MTLVSFVAAYGRRRVIGKDNALPWRLPADLARFKTLTLGKPVLMGRRTFESIGRALPGRRNIVLTRDAAFSPAGAETAASVDEALARCADAPEAVVIGGADVFAQLLPRADVLYLTEIDADFPGDVFFPSLDERDWRETERETHEPDRKDRYRYTFRTLRRRR